MGLEVAVEIKEMKYVETLLFIKVNVIQQILVTNKRTGIQWMVKVLKDPSVPQDHQVGKVVSS